MAAHPCVVCKTEVRQRQQGLQCDACDLWQHRTCESGVTQEEYRRMNRGELADIKWYCKDCSSQSTGTYMH